MAKHEFLKEIGVDEQGRTIYQSTVSFNKSQVHRIELYRPENIPADPRTPRSEAS